MPRGQHVLHVRQQHAEADDLGDPAGAELLAASGARQPCSAPINHGAGTVGPGGRGPWMEKHNGTYYLFYSGGAWTAPTGWATPRWPRRSGRRPRRQAIRSCRGPARCSVPAVAQRDRPRRRRLAAVSRRVGGYAQPRQLFLDRDLEPDDTVTIGAVRWASICLCVVSVPAAPESRRRVPLGRRRASARPQSITREAARRRLLARARQRFPIGATTVTCTAVDSAGRVGSASFPVVVADTTPPVVSVPPEMTAWRLGAQAWWSDIERLRWMPSMDRSRCGAHRHPAPGSRSV